MFCRSPHQWEGNHERRCNLARPAVFYVARHCHHAALWTQIVGKIRLSQTPWLNHSWHVALYVSCARPDHLAHSLR